MLFDVNLHRKCNYMADEWITKMDRNKRSENVAQNVRHSFKNM